MGELGVVPLNFAGQLAPLAGFRKILIHEYLEVDWDEVYRNLQRLEEIQNLRIMCASGCASNYRIMRIEPTLPN
jgi:uncharacterized protein YutE (UPF0331/DUF86 family)